MSTVNRFMNLFSGFGEAYGVYVLPDKIKSGLKAKGKAHTHRGVVDHELWSQHLDGVKNLGIIPINRDNQCRFGAIDIDVYSGLDKMSLYEKINSLSIKLFPCETKSGGIHVYLFMSEFIPAEMMREKLNDIASYIGFSGVEIFPKQNSVIWDSGDLGSWINMPYFGNSRKYMGWNAEEFLDEVENNLVSLEQLSELELLDPHTFFFDGPPCLQTLAQEGFGEGIRNDSMIQIAIYLKMKYPETWDKEIEEYNRQLMKPPLDSEELSAIKKSVKKKEYRYGCKKPPIQPHCVGVVCKSRPYGISDFGTSVKISSIARFDTDPPIWFVSIEGGGRMELISSDLVNQIRFQRRCLETFNFMPTTLKKATWELYINEVLKQCEIIEAPPDASYKGQLTQYLTSWLTGPSQADSLDGLAQERPYFCSDDNRHYFKLADFMQYLKRKDFKEFTLMQVSFFINGNTILEPRKSIKRIKGRQLNIWSVKNQYVSEDNRTIDDKIIQAPF